MAEFEKSEYVIQIEEILPGISDPPIRFKFGNYWYRGLVASYEEDDAWTPRARVEHAIRYNASSNVESIGIPRIRPGCFHPRVWRQHSGPKPSETYNVEYSDALVAFSNLQADVIELFRVIEPVATNRDVYGHSVRKSILLASMEAELLMRQALTANGYSRGRFTTNDYVKLLPVLRLDAWEVRLSNYPNYPSILPFEGWDPSSPTRTLGWYDDYNATKHDRVGNFERSRFDNAVRSLAGVFVLLASQFGKGTDVWDQLQYKSVFSIITMPRWAPEDQYIPPMFSEHEGWVAENVEFS